MTADQIAKRRKWFFFGISALATAITLASAGATYTINKRSFADWPDAGWIFAALVTAGIEITFALTLYGVSAALVGLTERALGGVLLGATVAVMVTNYVIHHRLVTGAGLKEWQMDYVAGVGPFSVFVVLGLIVGIILFNDDARKRRLEREVAYAAQRKAMEWEKDQLKSDEFEEHMAQYRPQVFEKVKRQLILPALPAARQKPGFTVEDEGPKGSSDLD